MLTDRLELRQWRESDLAPFAAMNADPVVMEHFPAPLDGAASEAMVDRARERIEQYGWGLYAVQIRDTGEFIGFTGLGVPRFEARFTPCVEVGWRLVRQAWGHGCASEAARAALWVGFESVGLDEIVSFTTTTNLRSQATMRRIGMTHNTTDDFDHPMIQEGHRLRRHVLYRKSRASWQADQASGQPGQQKGPRTPDVPGPLPC